MDEYYNEVMKLKNSTNIESLAGLEIDFIPSFIDYYKSLTKKFSKSIVFFISFIVCFSILEVFASLFLYPCFELIYHRH